MVRRVVVKPSTTKFYQVELTDGGKTVGHAYLYLIYNQLHQQPYALLEDVFVDKKYRGRGLGSQLVEKVIELAKELGCYKVIATSRLGRKGVHRFYQKLGFKKWGYEFRKDLL